MAISPAAVSSAATAVRAASASKPMPKDPQALLARAKAQAAGQQVKPQVRTPPIMDPNQKPDVQMKPSMPMKPAPGVQSGRMVPPGGGPNTRFPLNPGGQSPPVVSMPMPPGGGPTDGSKPLGLPFGGAGGGQTPPVVSMPGNAPQFGNAGQHLGVQQPGQGQDQQQQQQPGQMPAWQQLQQAGIGGQGSAAANQAMAQQMQAQQIHPQGADPMAAVSAALQARSQMQGSQGGQMQGQPGQLPTGMQMNPMIMGPQGMTSPGQGQGGAGQMGPIGGPWSGGFPPGAVQGQGQNLSQIYGHPFQPSVSYAPGQMMQGQPGQMPTGMHPTQPSPQPPGRAAGGMGGLAQRPFTPQ